MITYVQEEEARRAKSGPWKVSRTKTTLRLRSRVTQSFSSIIVGWIVASSHLCKRTQLKPPSRNPKAQRDESQNTHLEGLDEVLGWSFRPAHEEDLQALLAETFLHDFGPIFQPFTLIKETRRPLDCSVTTYCFWRLKPAERRAAAAASKSATAFETLKITTWLAGG